MTTAWAPHSQLPHQYSLRPQRAPGAALSLAGLLPLTKDSFACCCLCCCRLPSHRRERVRDQVELTLEAEIAQIEQSMKRLEVDLRRATENHRRLSGVKVRHHPIRPITPFEYRFNISMHA